ncbi:MAG: hypothetical protein KDI10_12635, partial [Halioglobus sp.]|nr:hypothetical protein [Halioglobus sp.]
IGYDRDEKDRNTVNTVLYRFLISCFRGPTTATADRSNSNPGKPQEITIWHNLYAKIRVAGFSIYFIL